MTVAVRGKAFPSTVDKCRRGLILAVPHCTGVPAVLYVNAAGTVPTLKVGYYYPPLPFSGASRIPFRIIGGTFNVGCHATG